MCSRCNTIELGAHLTRHVELKLGAVRCRVYWGVIHAQYTLISHPRGRACDCWYFERWCDADQRRRHEGGGRLLIVSRVDAMEEMAARPHEMLPRIRHRPVQLSLVSAVTQSLGC